MKTLWKIKKIIELFQSKNFEIMVEYKENETVCPKERRSINYELRQKKKPWWPLPSQTYQWKIDETFDSLDLAREYFDKFLEDNFILIPFEENGN